MDYQCDIEKGEALFAEGKNEQALSIFKNILENQPNNQEALNNVGVLFHAEGDIDEAENYFLKALSVKNDYLDALMNLIDLYLDSKRWKEAATQLEKCIAIHPHDLNFYNQLGTVYLEMGNTVKAKEALTKSLELNPDQKIVRESLSALEKKDSTPKDEVSKTPINILFVQEAPCIRNYKMATALRSKGHRVSLAYTKARLSQMYKGLSDDIYDECIQLKSHRQLWDISKDYDIIHCHNEPDILTVAAFAGDAPVVHDTHDLISLRANGDPNLSYFEGVANRGASGRVYSTRHQMEEAKKLYGVNGPSLVYYNYVSEADLPKKFLSKLSDKDGKVHIVYEGGIGGNGHRDFSSLFVDLANQGLHIHIYPASYNQEIAQYFLNHKNVHYYHPLSPKRIMEAMTQYDFGIIPFNLETGNKRFLDSTIANKLFEYMAAGLPVIASPLKSYIEYFEKNPVGITFQSDIDIIENIPKLKQVAKNTDFAKQIFTYEREVTKLEEFYRAVVNNNLPVHSNEKSDERFLARQHWKERGLVASYFQEGRQSAAIVDVIKKLREHEEIESVLEFGCNVGRNLYCLCRDIGGLELLGLDINETAVNAGRQQYQLPLSVGGQEELVKMEDGSFDIVFTVSVLDHIPQVDGVLKELMRVAKTYFIALEPYTGADKNAKEYAVADFSYFWDYPRLFAKLGAQVVYNKPCPISARGLGPFYHLYIVKPPHRQSGCYTNWLEAMVAKNCSFLTANEVIHGEKIALDRPNVVIRHDIDFSPHMGLTMAMTEKSLGAKSTFYIFTPERYNMEFPVEAFQEIEKLGWEIGYHTSTENLDEALSDIRRLERYFNILTTVPHMGNLTICKGHLQNHIKVLRDGQRFSVQDDGYIADNGGRLQQRVNVREDGTNEWMQVEENHILKFINQMEHGKVYHFLFHPCWYDKNLNFIGNLKPIQNSFDAPQYNQIYFNKGPIHIDLEKKQLSSNGHMLNKPAIFIGGTGRSGTTLLRKIMDTHHDIAAIPYETKLIGQKAFRDFPHLILNCPLHDRKRLIASFKQLWVKDFYRFQATWATKSGDDNWRGLHKWIGEEEIQRCLPILDRLERLSSEDDIYLTYGQFIDSLFATYVAGQGKTYWVEKTPQNSIFAIFLNRCFPNLKLLNIIRDGRDVACSLSNVSWGIKDPKKGLDWWATNLSQALRAQEKLSENVYLNIRYEDLVLQTEKTLLRITDFIGVDPDEALFSNDIFKDSVGRWRNELPEELQDYAKTKYGPLLIHIGYENGEKAPRPSGHKEIIKEKEKDSVFYDKLYSAGGLAKTIP
jgi:glycosyltransferase involved in cell wall biosynthesis/predicted TPR repeat methyltransferase